MAVALLATHSICTRWITANSPTPISRPDEDEKAVYPNTRKGHNQLSTMI